MLEPYYHKDVIEAGCDEAGRGCLAGPVYSAAVILPPDFKSELLNDSKQLSEHKRYMLREVIEREALAWAVGIVSNKEIDRINILRASILAMHRALDGLRLRPEEVIVDGNRFTPYAPPLPGGGRGEALPYTTIVKGDGKYMSIAAASILAKTYRDDCMLRLHREYPVYRWDSNKGYPSAAHRQAIREHGTSPYHRMTFNLLGSPQMEFDFGAPRGA
jgi:ribonuclease HII